ncbi:MAG TPA: carboxypeptidase regulatory-like domain-containing protein [Candidatus Acidoferrum sp.]|nr:carboxypeptidase regulatory-like domain-containing protein [Candidatus Acidoferrum sp.]
MIDGVQQRWSTTGLGLSLIVAIVLVMMTAAGVSAQTATTGDIAGVVTDPSSAVVPGVSVTLKNVETGSSARTTTNAQGAYNFAFLSPGKYSVSVSAAGFQDVTKTLTVSLGTSITTNLQLSISSQNQTIEVTDQAVGIQTEDANIETNFNAQQIAVLPNPGNDLSAVALTAPGVVMNTTGGSVFGGGNYEFFGLPSNSNVFTYDGANDNDPYFNINNSGATNLTLGLNDVQETSVVTNGYSGQFGGLAGANINYVSKSGSNAFHGNAEYWWNGRALNSNGYFRNQANGVAGSEIDPRLFVNANQYATSFGGPIRKNKSFFFVDYEGIRLVIPSSFSVNLPTQQFENAVIANLNSVSPTSVPFYNQLFGIWNAAPGAARAQNTIMGGGCSNVTNLAGVAFGATNPCAVQLQGGTSQATNDYLIVGRYDQNIGNNDKLFVRVQHESGIQATYTDPLNPAFDAHSTQPEWQSQLSETHTFGSNMVNNFIASLQWYSALFTMVNQAAEFQTLPQSVFLGDGSLFNLNNEGTAFPQGRSVTQYGIVDDFSWAKGRHNFRFGVNYRRDDVSDHNFTGVIPLAQETTLNDFAFGGVAPVSPTNPPGSTGNLLLQNFPLNTNVPIALYQLGWYASDELKVTSNLKVTLSMRFDHLSNPVCQTNCFQSLSAPFQDLNPTAPVNQALTTGLHTAFPSVTSIVYEPKVGFAWSPLGSKNTVIRGGFGIFSDAIPTGGIDDILTNAPNDPSFALFNGALSPGVAGNLNAQATAANAAFRANFASGGAVPAFNFFNAGKVQIPRYDEWDLEIQHSLGWKTTISAKYVGNHGEHEEITNPALNAFSPTGAAFGGLPLTQPDARFGVVAQTQNVGNSNYNGVVLSAAHNFTGGFQFQASYTYSHALDEISNNSLNPFGLNSATNVDVVTPLNPANIRQLNYGNADYDVRHSFVMNYVWSDAFRHLTARGPNALVKGWTFSGTIFKHTGFPYSIYSSNETSKLQGSLFGSGSPATTTAVLANVIGTPNINCGSAAAQLANPCYTAANFADPTTSFGNQRRNQFRGPGYFDTDFDVEKGFAIPKWESAQFSIGARFFNFFNHPNFAFPNTNIDSAQFGQITQNVSQPTTIYGSGLGADASPRVIELQGKFVF